MPESGRCINNATSSEVGLAHLLNVFNVIRYWSHLDWEFGSVWETHAFNSLLGFLRPWKPPSWADPGLGLPRHCFLIVSIQLLFPWPLDSVLSQNSRGCTALNSALLPTCPLTLSRPVFLFSFIVKP